MMPPCVLVATADGFLRAEYESALRNEGYQVVLADSGIQCLEQIRSAAPDLVVLDTDLVWGGADGVVAVLAEDSSIESVQILLISPRLNRSVLYEMGRFAISDYRTKPLTGRGIVQRIHAMGLRNAGAPPAENNNRQSDSSG